MDWAHQVRAVVEAPRHAQAERITLVCDNLDVHRLASLHEAFAPEEVLRLARKLALAHTPKHGSCLNMAEPELSVLTRQCLDQRFGQLARASELAQHWAQARNRRQAGIDWQFRTADARIKCNDLYPKLGGFTTYLKTPTSAFTARCHFAPSPCFCRSISSSTSRRRSLPKNSSSPTRKLGEPNAP